MLTITAIIRAKKGHEETMRQALIKVAENVKLNEPDTVGFFISQDASDPVPLMNALRTKRPWIVTMVLRLSRDFSTWPSRSWTVASR